MHAASQAEALNGLSAEPGDRLPMPGWLAGGRANGRMYTMARNSAE